MACLHLRNSRAIVLVLAMSIGAVLSLGAIVITATSAGAQDTCTFTTKGANWKLAANCTTDQTITVPGGLTLDGEGHTISAVDPAGGPFVGPVVVNGGSTMNVKDVTINGEFTDTTCNAGANNTTLYVATRLRGIEFVSASGSVKDSTVENINKGSGNTCDEGNGIVINDEMGGGPYTVSATNDTVTNFQNFGFDAIGNVTATFKNDTVSGYASSGDDGTDVYFAGVPGGEVSNSSLTAPAVFYSSLNLLDSSNVAIKTNKATGALVLYADCELEPQSSSNTVSGNTVTGVSFPIQITAVDDSSSTCGAQANNNVVKSNTLTDSGGSVGVNIYVGAPGTYTPSASYNSVINNTISGYSTPVGDGGAHDTVRNNHS